MAHVRDVRVLEDIASFGGGTGAYTVPGTAVPGYQRSNNARRDDGSAIQVGDNAWLYVECIDANGNSAADGSGNRYEGGWATYSAANQWTMTTTYASSNANAKVNWAAGARLRIGITVFGRFLGVFTNAATNELLLPDGSSVPLGGGAALKGGAATLADRIATISNFASPNAGGVFTGQYYDNSFQGTASSTLAGAANRWDMAPYYTSVPLTIDRIGCSVSTAVAASLFKIQIYDANAAGWPNNLLLETGDLSGATAAFAEATVSFTFASGVQYWLGVRHSSTCTLRTINVSSAVNLGLTGSNNANYATVLRRTLTYATAAPSVYNAVNADRTANITPPSIRFRAA